MFKVWSWTQRSMNVSSTVEFYLSLSHWWPCSNGSASFAFRWHGLWQRCRYLVCINSRNIGHIWMPKEYRVFLSYLQFHAFLHACMHSSTERGNSNIRSTQHSACSWHGVYWYLLLTWLIFEPQYGWIITSTIKWGMQLSIYVSIPKL